MMLNVLRTEHLSVSKQFSDSYRRVTSGIHHAKSKELIPNKVEIDDSLKMTALQYCHIVAGLTGIGLSRLFSASNLEDKIVGEDSTLSSSVGLFLQKQSIFRDYLEDVTQGRDNWPTEVTVLIRSFVCFI